MFYLVYKPLVFLLVLLLSMNFLIRIIPEDLFILEVVIVIPFIFSICSFVYLLLVNPGIPDRSHYLSESVLESIMSFIEYTQTEKFDRYKICKKCNIYVEKDINITHCDYCDICILGKWN